MAKTATIKPERRWEVEEAARTLVRAQEIKADKKMLRDIKALTKKQNAVLDKAMG